MLKQIKIIFKCLLCLPFLFILSSCAEYVAAELAIAAVSSLNKSSSSISSGNNTSFKISKNSQRDFYYATDKQLCYYGTELRVSQKNPIRYVKIWKKGKLNYNVSDLPKNVTFQEIREEAERRGVDCGVRPLNASENLYQATNNQIPDNQLSEYFICGVVNQ